jgi:deferrochelatase/peroxidase EfeB
VRWTQAAVDADTRAFLDDLQANILKGHGRHHSAHVFMNFQGLDPDQTAGIVRALGQACTSAYEQLRANKRLPPFLDGGTLRTLFLSASGYQALGPNVEIPPGEAFRAGMADRGTDLGDPDRCKWDPQGWADTKADAMFLIADADPQAVEADADAVKAWLTLTGVTVLAIERGLQQTRNFRPGVAEGVEHFGYVDGRSQPLILQEDIDELGLPLQAVTVPGHRSERQRADVGGQLFRVPQAGAERARLQRGRGSARAEALRHHRGRRRSH